MTLSRVAFQKVPMSQHIDFIDGPLTGSPGDIGETEKWWVERHEALKQTGYLLRSRYRPDWKPSWVGTNKFFIDCEDAQRVGVSDNFPLPTCYLYLRFQIRLGMDATRISDGKPVMLKMLPSEEGPYELEINKLFSTEPLFSNPRNHCVQLLDVVWLPNDPPIIVHPLLRPFYDPRLQTYGEFVTFFAQICEVSLVYPLIALYSCLLDQGVQFMHENNVAHRFVVSFSA